MKNFTLSDISRHIKKAQKTSLALKDCKIGQDNNILQFSSHKQFQYFSYKIKDYSFQIKTEGFSDFLLLKVKLDANFYNSIKKDKNKLSKFLSQDLMHYLELEDYNLDSIPLIDKEYKAKKGVKELDLVFLGVDVGDFLQVNDMEI